jgi:hypothetical protein
MKHKAGNSLPSKEVRKVSTPGIDGMQVFFFNILAKQV